MRNEHLSDSLPPFTWLDKQAVKFRSAIGSGQRSGKAEDLATTMGNEDVPGSNLHFWQIDGIGIGNQYLSVSRICERSSSLQSLERVLLLQDRLANGDGIWQPYLQELRTDYVERRLLAVKRSGRT